METLFLEGNIPSGRRHRLEMPNPLFLSVIDAVRFVSGFSGKFASVDKYKWSYIERPGKDEQNADVVVFLHGFSSMKESWVRVARGIDKRYKIIIPDLPGHGRTTPVDVLANYSMPAQAQRLHEFLESEVPAEKRIHLVGCSMGGMLAGVYAGLFPKRVKTLTMLCPAGVTMPTKSDLLVMLEESGRNLLLAHTMEDIHEMNQALTFKPRRIPNALASIAAAERKKQLPVLEKIVSDALQNPVALEELLPNIRAKTLVLWGKDDRVLNVSSVEVIQQQLHSETQAHVRLFDNCGHLIHHEKYAECTAAINKHLADQVCPNPEHVQNVLEQKSCGKIKQFSLSARMVIPKNGRLSSPSASKGTSYVIQ